MFQDAQNHWFVLPATFEPLNTRCPLFNETNADGYYLVTKCSHEKMAPETWKKLVKENEGSGADNASFENGMNRGEKKKR